MSPEDQFRDAIQAAGLTPPDEIEPGRLHRFSSNGKRADDAGWCKLFPDLAGGVFGDHRTGLSETWQAERAQPYTAAEREAFRLRCESDRREREAETARRQAGAATAAAAIWRAAKPAGAGHPYLVRKGVKPVQTLRELPAEALASVLGYVPRSKGEPLAGRVLVAPVKVGGKASTAELIDETGRKSAVAGGRKTGGFWAAQALPAAVEVLLIGEGVATVLSAAEATGNPVVAALSSSNLPAVARTMRERFPAARLILLADLVKSSGEPDPHAVEAAQAVGGLLAVPDFGPDRLEGETDFNDLALARGLEAVARCIASAEVSRVSGVQPSNGGLSADTPAENAEVSQVSGPAANPVPGMTERPSFRVFDDWLEHGDAKFRPGVWYFGTDKEGSGTQSWICSPLHVLAVTFDGQDNNFGRLLRFKNSLGRWREWAMPCEFLSGLGNEIRGELLAMGVEIDPGTKARNLLATYLQARPPKRRMRCALQVGWCSNSFVLPDAVIGPGASGVIFQSGERGHDEYTRGGTLKGWRAEIAARAVGNPIFVLGISGAFAGPLLALCNAESGGIHFDGDSSTGKTTAIEAACSVWGGPNYKRSWRATANGMEGAAALFNDNLLALDEISECDPREVGAIVYALGNGRGKQRAGRTGAARAVTRWRCFVLSSGERTIETTMAEGGHRAKAGQSVRLLDVPVARLFGCFDTLHRMPTGAALSDAIKRAAATHYGHAGRAFLERLTHDTRDFCALLERIKSLPEFSADGGEGQDKRAGGRFALLALAGELATEYDITGWSEGEATKTAAEGFKLWRSRRGRGNDERRQILERVSGFIERHGDGRFSSDAAEDREAQVRDRAGWWRDSDEGREYLFNADGMREALKGFDFTRALDVLQEAGALPKPGADGKRARFNRIGRRGVKLYQINPDKLGSDHGA